MYRSPSENNDDFIDFLNTFDNPLKVVGKSSPLFAVILSDFNARSTSRWVNDKTITKGIIGYFRV